MEVDTQAALLLVDQEEGVDTTEQQEEPVQQGKEITVELVSHLPLHIQEVEAVVQVELEVTAQVHPVEPVELV